MVQYEKCERWFHRDCERIPQYILECESVEWYCYRCTITLQCSILT